MFIIWVVTGVLVYFAIHRITCKEYEIGGLYMLITAAAAVIFNIMYVFYYASLRGFHLFSSLSASPYLFLRLQIWVWYWL